MPHSPATVIGLLCLAIALIYTPMLIAVLVYERKNAPPARHHDHLIPATPRSARR